MKMIIVIQMHTIGGNTTNPTMTKVIAHLYCLKIYNTSKDFPKERYNTYAKSGNSNLYTKYPGATYSGLLLGTMRCL